MLYLGRSCSVFFFPAFLVFRCVYLAFCAITTCLHYNSLQFTTRHTPLATLSLFQWNFSDEILTYSPPPFRAKTSHIMYTGLKHTHFLCILSCVWRSIRKVSSQGLLLLESDSFLIIIILVFNSRINSCVFFLIISFSNHWESLGPWFFFEATVNPSFLIPVSLCFIQFQINTLALIYPSISSHYTSQNLQLFYLDS